MPLWAVQGHRYESQKNFFKGPNTTVADAQMLLEDEAQTLEARYRPRTQESSGGALIKDWDMNDPNLQRIVSRCQDFEALGFGAAALSEEQERELAPETEQERQVERPPRMEHEIHSVHPDLRELVNKGKLKVNSSAYSPAFRSLELSSAARFFALANFPTDLLATTDYVRTVKVPAGTSTAPYVSDSYQRPVQWILSLADSDCTVLYLMIISPFEANLLMDDIIVSSKVTLHLFVPRINTRYEPLDELTLFVFGRAFDPSKVSRSLTMQLNLFAGSLYLRSFTEYIELCDFLGLLVGTATGDQQVSPDGFITPPVGKWGFKTSPVAFLRVLLMKIRREGEGVEKTHLGKILNGVRLEESDFEDMH